jgi:peroxiredoxin
MQMTKRTRTWMMIVAAALVLEAWALYVVGVSPERWRPAMIVKDEPAARALYETMVRTMREAGSLTYESVCGDVDGRASSYKVWLAKPGFFRIELLNGPSDGPSVKRSNLVGDSNNLWVFWSGDRPYLWFDDQESYNKTRSNLYVKKAAPAGRNSIPEEIDRLGIAWFGCILNPGVFHGRADILDPYVDGICSRGTNKIRGEKCDVIEISYMKAQRARHLWISRRDHLPRMVKEIVRVADNRITVEEWSNMSIDDDVPQGTFTWSPPVDWQPWSVPTPEDMLVKSGQEAPDFELCESNGSKIRLSEFRGKVVWLYLWQCGSPQCREELPHLQKLYEKHKDKGLVVLGLNFVDDKRIAQVFLRENPMTFPIIHDCSPAARRAVREHYKNKTAAVPMSCIIDPQGRIVDAWCGYEGNHKRALAALQKAGLQLTTDN